MGDCSGVTSRPQPPQGPADREPKWMTTGISRSTGGETACPLSLTLSPASPVITFSIVSFTCPASTGEISHAAKTFYICSCKWLQRYAAKVAKTSTSLQISICREYCIVLAQSKTGIIAKRKPTFAQHNSVSNMHCCSFATVWLQDTITYSF